MPEKNERLGSAELQRFFNERSDIWRIQLKGYWTTNDVASIVETDDFRKNSPQIIIVDLSEEIRSPNNLFQYGSRIKPIFAHKAIIVVNANPLASTFVGALSKIFKWQLIMGSSSEINKLLLQGEEVSKKLKHEA